MDWTLISDIVGDVGFPIMIATILVYQNKANNDASNDAFFKLYYELKKTIDKNTEAISELARGLRDRDI